MNLMVVIAINFLMQDGTHIVEIGKLFESAGADDPILKPAIRPFDFAFGLWGKRIADLDRHQSHDLTPLRIDLIRLEHMLAPNTIPVLPKDIGTMWIKRKTRRLST